MASSDLVRTVLGRLRIFWLRERAVAAASWLAMRVLPSQRIAVVHGWPDAEGNAVEVIRGLLRRYPGTVYWLRNAGTMGSDVELADTPPGKLVSVRVNTLRAFLVSWRAEATFFTHGLKSAVPPPRSRLVVNLWHGDGPKLTDALPRCASTVAVATTHLWAREKARIFRLPVEDIAVVGNPRLDSVLGSSSSATRALLGLGDDGNQLVLWLPTYRRGWDGGRITWSDGESLSRTLSSRIDVPDGVRLVVKPHPFDTDDYTALGATVLRNEDLVKAGVSLLQLMAASDALVSDASSAWVDYLAFDCPVGFFLPDHARYGEVRGYNVPDLFDVLPGPVLMDHASLGGFLADVRDGAVGAPSTWPAYARVGFHAELPVTDHLFDWLDEYQLRRGARRLFSPATPRP